MVGRITVVAVGAAGIVVTGLSVASATLWRPDDVLRASVTTDSPYVVTAPGVVEMGGQPTTVTVKTVDGKKAPLVIAVGRDTDVVGWVGDDPHETVSGMSGWSSLRITNPAGGTAKPTGGEPAQDDPAQDEPAQDEPAQDEPAQGQAEYQSPAGSDMWVAEASGEGRAELKRWAPGSQYPGRWSVLVANPTKAQTTVEMAWPRDVSTPWLIPGLIIGLGAVSGAVYAELRRRGILAFGRKTDADPSTGKDTDSPPPRSRREVRAAKAGGQSDPVSVVGGSTTDVTDEPTTEGRGEAIPGLVPPGPFQPPPASPGRPRTPAWSQAPLPPAAPAAPAPAPAPTGLAPSPIPSARRMPSPAPPVPSAPPASGRRFTWPPTLQSAPPGAEQAPTETGQTEQRRGPFGRGARPAPEPPSAPTGAPQPRPAPLGGWMPGRGGRTGSVPQVPAPTEQTGSGRRPAWLGRTRSPAPLTGPVPAAPPQGTAPRLSTGPLPGGPPSAGPPSDPAPRGDAWRQIWGISTDDGSQEDR